MAVPREAARDAVLTRDHVRFLSAVNPTVAASHDGTPHIPAIDAAHHALLARQAELLETAVDDLACARHMLLHLMPAEIGELTDLLLRASLPEHSAATAWCLLSAGWCSDPLDAN